MRISVRLSVVVTALLVGCQLALGPMTIGGEVSDAVGDCVPQQICCDSIFSDGCCDLWSRPTMTGDWGGVRSSLRESGRRMLRGGDPVLHDLLELCCGHTRVRGHEKFHDRTFATGGGSFQIALEQRGKWLIVLPLGMLRC